MHGSRCEAMEPNCFLLTGADGYLGRHLSTWLRSRGVVVGVSRSGRAGIACDLRDLRAVGTLARALKPSCIVHAAGLKDLAACEQSPHAAYDSNVTTTLNLLKASPGVPVLYMSAEYVFSGNEGPYLESSSVGPRTAFGRSKVCAETTGLLLAEGAFTVIRVGALYDSSAPFLRFLSEELGAGRPLNCFIDAHYSPTLVDDLAKVLIQLIDSPGRPSIVHVAGPRTSQYEFVRNYARAFGFDERLVRPSRLGPGARFLYPDLSLSTQLASTTLGFIPTDHAVALGQIARGARHAESRAVQPVLQFPGAEARSHRQRAMEEIHYVAVGFKPQLRLLVPPLARRPRQPPRLA